MAGENGSDGRLTGAAAAVSMLLKTGASITGASRTEERHLGCVVGAPP